MMFYQQPVDFLSLLPPIVGQTEEFRQIAGQVNGYFDLLHQSVQRMAENRILALCDEQGLARWEKIAHIQWPIEPTLQARRDAVQARLMAQPPINLQTVKRVLEAFLGVPVDLQVSGFIVRVGYRGTSLLEDLSPLYALLYELLPANLVMEIYYQYLTWGELDGQQLDFSQLDALALSLSEFERGEWI